MEHLSICTVNVLFTAPIGPTLIRALGRLLPPLQTLARHQTEPRSPPLHKGCLCSSGPTSQSGGGGRTGGGAMATYCPARAWPTARRRSRAPRAPCRRYGGPTWMACLLQSARPPRPPAPSRRPPRKPPPPPRRAPRAVACAFLKMAEGDRTGPSEAQRDRAVARDAGHAAGKASVGSCGVAHTCSSTPAQKRAGGRARARQQGGARARRRTVLLVLTQREGGRVSSRRQRCHGGPQGGRSEGLGEVVT